MISSCDLDSWPIAAANAKRLLTQPKTRRNPTRDRCDAFNQTNRSYTPIFIQLIKQI